jgi:hypothetical protein
MLYNIYEQQFTKPLAEVKRKIVKPQIVAMGKTITVDL